MSGLLIRTMDFKCPSVLVPLYISKVRPLLEYGNVVWCPYKKKDIKVIEKVQQHFTKYITGMYKLSYSKRLFRLKLPSIEYRRIREGILLKLKKFFTICMTLKQLKLY